LPEREVLLSGRDLLTSLLRREGMRPRQGLSEGHLLLPRRDLLARLLREEGLQERPRLPEGNLLLPRWQLFLEVLHAASHDAASSWRTTHRQTAGHRRRRRQ
jgi:hypothetical protein